MGNKQVATKRSLAPWLILFSCSACGGGGGYVSSEPEVPPAPPPPISSHKPLGISASNAPDVVHQGGYTTETVFNFALSAAEQTMNLIGKGLSGGQLCHDGGGITSTLQDNDHNGTLTSGDRVVIELTGCEESNTGLLTTGVISVDVDEVDLDSGTIVRGTASTKGPLHYQILPTEEEWQDVEGSLSFMAFDTGHTEVIVIEMPEDGAVVIDFLDSYRTSGGVDRVSAFTAKRAIRLSANSTAEYEVSWRFRLDSEALGGIVDCEVSEDLQGLFLDDPEQGQLICAGSNNSAVRVTTQPEDQFKLEADADGDGTFDVIPVSAEDCSDWFDCQYVRVFIRSLAVHADLIDHRTVPDIDSARLEMDIRDVAYSPAANVIYVAATDRILVIDAESLARQSEILLPYAPNTLAISDDGSRLWIGYSDEPVVQALTTSSNTLGPPISLLSLPPEVDAATPVARSIAVAPGSPDLIVVQAYGRYEVVGFNAGVQLPDTVDSSLYIQPTFLDASSLVIGHTDFGNRLELSIAALNPSTGLNLTRTMPNYLKGESGRLVRGPDYVYVASGRIFDLANEAIKGEVPRPYYELPVVDVTLDADGTYLYTLATNNIVARYTRDPLQLQAAYKFDEFARGTAVGFFVSGEHLFIATETILVQVKLSDIVTNFPQTACHRSDLSGLALPGLVFKLDCAITDAVYDRMRDDVIAAMPGSAGPAGNSIVFIDPLLGEVEDVVPLGTTAGKLAITADGARLYASVPEGSEIAVLNLNTRSFESPIRLGYALDDMGNRFGPYFPTTVAASPIIGTDVVVALAGGDLAFYMNGARATRIGTASDVVRDVFLSMDGSTALALARTESSLFDVSASGTAQTSVVDTLPYEAAKQLASEVFTVDGRIFDLSDGSITTDCIPADERAWGRAVTPDESGSIIHYVNRDLNGWRIAVCDRASGSLSMTAPIAVHENVVPRLVTAFPVANERMVIVTTLGILIFDTPSATQ